MATLDSAEDPIMDCVVNRAMDFHGRRVSDSFESVVMQRYSEGGHFRHHTDSFPDSTVAETGGNRVSTFLVYLEANCTGGGTNFPHLPRPNDESWCDLVDCSEEAIEGTTFKPIAGNAVYWKSLQEDGSSDSRTLHSATPVRQGMKAILNIWTWRQLT